MPRIFGDSAQNPGLEKKVSRLCEIKCAGHWTTYRNRILFQPEVILPFDLILELNPRTNSMKIIFNHSHAFTRSDDIMVSRHEIKALIIHLTSINSQPGHHVPRVSLFFADINSFPPSTVVWMPSLDNVSGIDKDIRINISRIDPLAREVFG